MSKTTITPEQILAAEGEVLSRLLGQVLQPKKCFIEQQTARKRGYKLPGTHLCNTCGVWTDTPEKHKQADPIPLTWDNAMKWRDWAVDECGVDRFWDSLNAVHEHEEIKEYQGPFGYWVFDSTTPKHYLKAAAICKLNSEKGKK